MPSEPCPSTLPNTLEPEPRHRSPLLSLAPPLALLVFLGLLFAWAMDRGLNHDEHQFLAPGTLLSRDGLLPFRDYPLFHLPNLAFIYAGLDRLTGYPILSARLFCAFCTWLTGLILVLQCYRNLPFGSRRWIPLGACLALGLLFCDPLFSYSTGKIWNHELPTMLALLATVLVVESSRRNRFSLSLTAGLCVGLAVGTRLTFAPVAFPLWVAHFAFPLAPRRRFLLSIGFALGTLGALAPSLYLFQNSPDAFLFGNLQFPRLRLSDPTNTRIQKTVSYWRKIRFLFKEVMIPSWPLFTAYLAVGVAPAIAWMRRRQEVILFPCALVLTVILFLIAGCFAPSRYQYQHYFVLIPFLVLGTIYGASLLRTKEKTLGSLARFVLPLLCVSSFFSYTYGILKKEGRSGFSWIYSVATPSEWFPVRARAVGAEIRAHVTKGKVLTLAPIWVIEAGLPIYAEFATGPFAWRSAELVPSERRGPLKMVAPSDLESFLSKDPPAAILTGVEEESLEQPLIAYADVHAYQRIKLTRKRELWLRQTPQ